MFRLLRVSPPHGWHAVWWELGIVTLGVLIALAAEQAVQELHWRQQTKATTDALSNEVATSAADAVERVAVEDCLRSRIRDLTRELNRSDGKWTANPLKLGPARNVARVMPSIPPVYRAPGRDWNEDVWEAAKSTGMINHLRRDRTASYSQVYAIIRGLRMLQQDEAALAPKLAFLSFDQQLDNQSRVNALMILGELDMVNAQIGLASRNLANQAKELRLIRPPGAGSIDAGDFPGAATAARHLRQGDQAGFLNLSLTQVQASSRFTSSRVLMTALHPLRSLAGR